MHCENAFSDCLDLTEKYKRRNFVTLLIHCFTNLCNSTRRIKLSKDWTYGSSLTIGHKYALYP
ncbi:MAG: hypothetical protein K6A61_07090 [Butyrivibrio sp.]|nr:hypothetical protein [Butyrivibrio sp.]